MIHIFVYWETLNVHTVAPGRGFHSVFESQIGGLFFASLFDTTGYNVSFKLLWIHPTDKIIHCNGSFGAVTGLDISV